jgi:hypothetical protein
MAGHVYVSYDGHDVGYVRRLVDHLAASWLTVWVDQETESGEHWNPDLEAPLRAASVVLVIMSPASQQSDRVRGEIMYAHSIGKPIIPLLLAGRAFFTQGNNAPENVIGGRLPDDSLIDRLGDLSQTPITHRRSGKPGRGSSSRERDSTTSTGTALIPPTSVPSGRPGAPRSGGPAYGGSGYGLERPGYGGGPYPPPPAAGPRRYQPDDDFGDDEPRRFRPALLLGVAAVVVLVVGVISVVLLSGSRSSNKPTTPVGASNPRTTGAVPSGTSAAFEGPTLTGNPTASTSKKPTTTTTKPATTTSTVTTTNPPPAPNLSTLTIAAPASLSLADAGSTATGKVTLDGTYTSDITVTLGASAPSTLTVPASVTVPAGQLTATFPMSAPGPDTGTVTVTATLSGVNRTATIDVTA